MEKSQDIQIIPNFSFGKLSYYQDTISYLF